MKIIHGVELKLESYEELLPDFSPEFPYIASRVELDRFIGRQSPWHWHKEVELFYMEQGELEYDTPQGKTVFPVGSGGFVNSNVLHMSRAREGTEPVTSLLHLFSPLFISGQKGSVIDQKYVAPLMTASHIEIMGLYPDDPEQGRLLGMLRRSFELSEEDHGYEIRLRAVLSELWCGLLDMAGTWEQGEGVRRRNSDQIKMMIAFIHKNCGEKITVADIAASAFCSERECFRAFRDCLNMTPVEYATSYRLQKACYMLEEGNEPVTGISQACGFGSSSYFGKIFRQRMGCSPGEYRAERQDNDIK